MVFYMLSVIALGAIVGWVASRIMGGGDGLLWNIAIGIIGSIIGNFLFGLLGFAVFGTIANFIVSLVGACLFIGVGRKLL